MDPPRVDPDIRRSWTTASKTYFDPDAYARQVEAVFARSWQWIGDGVDLKAPGHVRPLTLLEGCLDEPLVLTHDAERGLSCLSNVCTHRGALVVEGEGHVHGLRCRYHGRKFALDGSFVSMPEFDGVEGFPAACDSLPRLPLRAWGPLLFTSLDPSVPFETWMGPVSEWVSFLPWDRAVFDASGAREYYMDAHWALYVDNYLEEFHIPYVHGSSLEGIDYGAYRTERFAFGSLQLGIGRAGEARFDLPPDHPCAGESVSAFYFWLFPSTMLNVYPWGLSLNVVEPLGPGRTRVRFRPYVWSPEKRYGIGGGLDRVEMEDEEIVESVQRGVRSRLYDRGRFSPRREVGTHQFHVLLDRVLGGDGEGRG